MFTRAQFGLRQVYNISQVVHYNSSSLRDTSYGNHSHKVTEHVSEILESWKYVFEVDVHHQHEADMTLSLAFGELSIPVATPALLRLFQALEPSQNSPLDIVLLGKTRKLTSHSDWHDLSVVLFSHRRFPLIQSWVTALTTTFMVHARDHIYFTLLSPRPSILEANAVLSLSHQLRVGHFQNHDICSTVSSFEKVIRERLQKYTTEPRFKISPGKLALTPRQVMRQHISHCQQTFLSLDIQKDSEVDEFKQELSSLEFYCLGGIADNPCLMSNLPTSLLHSIDKEVRGGPWDRVHTAGDLMTLMQSGIIRFRNQSSSAPRSLCWETG